MQLPQLRTRATDSHKGTFGRVLIVGGSRGMTGAPSLSGIAALKSGAGLVTVAIPDPCLDAVAAHNMCYMTVPLPADKTGRISADASSELSDLAARSTSLGLGPGMSGGDGVATVVADLYANYAGPMVVDADALNALAALPDGLPAATGPRILTPHIGEFRRLMGKPDLTTEECRAAAQEFAAANNVILLLKGPGTLVSDGTLLFTNTTGNPGMATGGAGDVLTGVITALLGQGYSAIEAAALGAHIHGLAGDLAAQEIGQVSMNADDILAFLPQAFRQQAAEHR